MRAEFPELFNKFVELEKSGFKTKGWTCFYDHKPLSARELAKQKTLPKIGEKDD